MASERGYPLDEQDLWIAQASKNVKKCAFFVRKAIDEDNMQEALRQSAAMLGELRTSLLGPHKYYQLYVQVNDELRGLEAYFSDEPSKNRSFAHLYELVQHAGNVLPRLYLLCTVGACFIRAKEAPAKPVLQDMADMCKGVQHPTRGLFLRAYLVQCCRRLLPDIGSGYEGGEGGDVVDAIEFLLANFTEMNKLWVRMKHQNGVRGQEQREKERSQLSDLVGKNLTQISQLEGLTFQLYRDLVLPRVLQQVVACKDELAQGYLMQCIAAAFPDDFHVGTLDSLLAVLPELQPGVKLASVMGSLLDRLAGYTSKNPSVVSDLDSIQAFSKMCDAVSEAHRKQEDMPAADVAAVYSGLLSFSIAVYPDRLDFIDDVLKTCHGSLQARNIGADVKAERQLIALMTIPLEKYGVLTVLELRHFPSLISLLHPSRQRDFARRIAQTLLKPPVNPVRSVDQVTILLRFIQPLIVGVPGMALDADEVSEDAGLLACVMNALRTQEDDETQFQILATVLQNVLQGGPIRASSTIPPICFIALQTLSKSAMDNKMDKEKFDQRYRFLHKAITALVDTARSPELALQLFLATALSSSQDAKIELLSYEFFEQAFTLFEESISDSRQQIRSLLSITSALHRCRVFGEDNRDALVLKTISYCSRLLKRSDQCLAVLHCCHLYWQEKDDSTTIDGWYPPVRDGKGVLSCLKRAIKIAHASQQQLAVVERKNKESSGPGLLFVEILNSYVYFYDHGVDSLTSETVRSVIELVSSEVGSEACAEDVELQNFFKKTLSYANSKLHND